MALEQTPEAEQNEATARTEVQETAERGAGWGAGESGAVAQTVVAFMVA
jgi:hypothetical protein